MELRIHIIIQIPIFIILYLMLGMQTAIIATLVHFIPSIDYAMKIAGIGARLHRKVFHNIFVIAVAGLLLFMYAGISIAVIGLLNMLFHIALDTNKGGVELFFPFSKFRLRLKR